MVNNFSTKQVKFVSKLWGFEQWIVNNPQYCGKLLYFAKGKCCAVHYHEIKDETFYLHSGELEVWFYDDAATLKKYIEECGQKKVFDVMEKIILKEGDTFHIPPGRVHTMIALKNSELFEFSTEHKDEDSIRLIESKDLNN